MVNWRSDTKRRDGLYVHEFGAGRWSIRHKGNAITTCPCCDKPLLSASVARRVADRFFPLPDDEQPREVAGD